MIFRRRRIAGIIVRMSETLPATTQLAEQEAIIERGMASFVEVGQALMRIREGKLYRDSFSTFEEYCRERWNFTPQHALRFVASASIIENLKSEPIGSLPSSEAVARPLTKIKDPEQQRAVWAEAVETAPNGRVTAKHVESVVKSRTNAASKRGRARQVEHAASPSTEPPSNTASTVKLRGHAQNIIDLMAKPRSQWSIGEIRISAKFIISNL